MRQEIRVVQNGTSVVIVAGGTSIQMPWQVAAELSAALRQVGKRSEEWESAQRIAADQAVLLRAGAPIGLTSNPLIQDEAAGLAAHDRGLRRYMPGGVKGRAHVGIPRVIAGGRKQ